MDAPAAARACLPLIERCRLLSEDNPETGKAHLRDMVRQMQEWDQTQPNSREKAMRWLGWLQACIVIGGGATLQEMKLINRDTWK